MAKHLFRMTTKINVGELWKCVGKRSAGSFFWFEEYPPLVKQNSMLPAEPIIRSANIEPGTFVIILDSNSLISHYDTRLPACSVLWVNQSQVVLLPKNYLRLFALVEQAPSDLKEAP